VAASEQFLRIAETYKSMHRELESIGFIDSVQIDDDEDEVLIALVHKDEIESFNKFARAVYYEDIVERLRELQAEGKAFILSCED
jgi:hypothetical protein